MLTEPELALRSLCFLVICNPSIGCFLGKRQREKQKGNPPQKKLKLQSASKVGETVPLNTYFERHPFTLHEAKLWKFNDFGCPSPPSVGSFIPLIRRSCGCQHYQSYESSLSNFASGCLYVTAPKNIKKWLKYLIFFVFVVFQWISIALNFLLLRQKTRLKFTHGRQNPITSLWLLR